jgi:hypothetical protein
MALVKERRVEERVRRKDGGEVEFRVAKLAETANRICFTA